MAGKTRQKSETRKRQILQAAYDVALTKGFDKLTRMTISKKAKISLALLTHFFYLDDIKMEVLKRADAEKTMDKILGVKK